MTYSVKEIFYTLQEEGINAGKPPVFCRFAGCNLWSGRKADRSNAVCKFCDTDFVGVDGTLGAKYPDAVALAATVASLWPYCMPARKSVQALIVLAAFGAGLGAPHVLTLARAAGAPLSPLMLID